MSLLGAVPDMINGQQSLTTLFGLLENTSEQPYTGRRSIEFDGSVRAENVSFSYHADGGPPLLCDVSFRVETGQRMCITGSNGAGKSTLLMLLLGFYRPQQGMLYAGGISYEDLDMRSLRRGIGTVMQTPLLFTGSVRDNIAYGSPHADDSEIEEAARAALAHEFIVALDDGYATEVGDEAHRLSGGQRQRIGIARALLGKPKMLILDEPTTYLDRHSVTELIERLSKLPFAPAIVTVTHDAQLLRGTDYSYHIEDGCMRPTEQDRTRVA
jgi:ABC-type bacteriocin/lantibiotic exporter with double-glycine peptidase domain